MPTSQVLLQRPKRWKSLGARSRLCGGCSNTSLWKCFTKSHVTETVCCRALSCNYRVPFEKSPNRFLRIFLRTRLVHPSCLHRFLCTKSTPVFVTLHLLRTLFSNSRCILAGDVFFRRKNLITLSLQRQTSVPSTPTSSN